MKLVNGTPVTKEMVSEVADEILTAKKAEKAATKEKKVPKKEKKGAASKEEKKTAKKATAATPSKVYMASYLFTEFPDEKEVVICDSEESAIEWCTFQEIYFFFCHSRPYLSAHLCELTLTRSHVLSRKTRHIPSLL